MPQRKQIVDTKISNIKDGELKTWLMGLSPIEYFATLRSGVLCCQNCERTALRRAAELYEDAHKHIADLEQELTLSSQSAKAYFENMKELEKRIAELEEIHRMDLIKHERLERELKLASSKPKES